MFFDIAKPGNNVTFPLRAQFKYKFSYLIDHIQNLLDLDQNKYWLKRLKQKANNRRNYFVFAPLLFECKLNLIHDLEVKMA